MVKRIAAMMMGLLLVCVLASCGTRKGYRDDDPYEYKRGHWNLSKGGLFDDLPQFTLQMLESMFDYGAQPVDPPSEYETTTAVDSTSPGADTLAASEAVGAGASGAARAEMAADAADAVDAAVSAGSNAIEAGAPKSVGGRIAAEAAAEAADAAAKAAQPEMTWK
jgi:hypothetical protein